MVCIRVAKLQVTASFLAVCVLLQHSKCFAALQDLQSNLGAAARVPSAERLPGALDAATHSSAQPTSASFEYQTWPPPLSREAQGNLTSTAAISNNGRSSMWGPCMLPAGSSTDVQLPAPQLDISARSRSGLHYSYSGLDGVRSANSLGRESTDQEQPLGMAPELHCAPAWNLDHRPEALLQSIESRAAALKSRLNRAYREAESAAAGLRSVQTEITQQFNKLHPLLASPTPALCQVIFCHFRFPNLAMCPLTSV